MPSTTRNSPIESLKLPTDYSPEKFERALEFARKVKEIDKKDPRHRGIFVEYITAMKLCHSGSLNRDDLKNRITDLFKNCDVLLDGFNQFLNDDSDSASPREDIVVDRRMVEYVKALRKESEGLRLGFIEAFVRLKEHGDGEVVKKEVERMLRDYPRLKQEFRMILLEQGLIVQEKEREEIARKEVQMVNDSLVYYKEKTDESLVLYKHYLDYDIW